MPSLFHKEECISLLLLFCCCKLSQILAKCIEKIPAVCPGLHNLHVFGKPLEVRVPPARGGGCHKYLSIGFCILAERLSMKMDTQAYASRNKKRLWPSVKVS